MKYDRIIFGVFMLAVIVVYVTLLSWVIADERKSEITIDCYALSTEMVDDYGLLMDMSEKRAFHERMYYNCKESNETRR